MKKLTLLFLVYIFSSTCFSQDIINHYNPDNLVGQFNLGSPTYYDGEYQIRITSMYWVDEALYPPNNFISYDFECVSYPFVPDCYNNSTCTPSGNSRDFIVLLDNLLGSIEEPYTGYGWILTPGKNVYKYSDPLGFDIPNNTSYPTTLVTRAYISDAPWEDDRMILPHTILRITLNVHEGTTIDGEIKVKISWLYDNTRGRMKHYPFVDNNNGQNVNSVELYDVIFRPKFIYDGFPGVSNHHYNTTTNQGWFNGAHPAGIDPLGSINYFHEEDVPNIYHYHPGYCGVLFPDDNLDFYFYPAPYALLSPPLRNSSSRAYAGFDDYGQYGTLSTTVETGILHSYRIDQFIDLENINPSEKIIYNPSKVLIDCDLTFPEDYKFLTVHGKYPDKAWVMENNPGYDDLREVLCPSDQVDDDGDFLTEYELSSVELTIEPGVTIMDAKFTGSGTIFWHPDNIKGNFKIYPGLNSICQAESMLITDPQLTWERDFEFEGSLISIEPGAMLTIKCTVEVDSDTKIIVKRGGKLIIDGGTITPSGGMWPGIEVWGTATASQNPVDQGWVQVINGGTIEKADIGIQTIKIESNGSEGTMDYSYTGGIVQATDAVFKNNKIAVQFYDYGNISVSYFTDCDFITDNYYPNAAGPDYFIKMNEVHGIGFTGCNFINQSNDDCSGNGIYSLNSGFEVKGKCISGDDPCTNGENGEFTNLKRGIYATSGGSLYFPDIDHITFSENYRGAYFSAMENGVVTNCTITTGPNCGGSSYGVYLDGSTGYTVEGNNFYEGTWDGIGVVVNNSGGEANGIYRNYFEGLKFGIIAQNKNRAVDGTGLELKCNTYEDMQWDKVVLWRGQFMNKEYGIAESQGSPGSNPEDMAGNLFDDHGEPYFDDFDDINNEANNITYFHPDLESFGIGYENVIPKDYNDKVNVEDEEVEPEWTFVNGCPPEDDPGGGGGLDEGLKSSIAKSNHKIDSTQNLLAILIDGGDTEAVQFEVETSIPPETMQVYNDLMNKSPYLSDTVVSTAIEKEDVLPGAMIRDIMVANPHTAKSEELMNKLDERWDPLPEYMKAQILQGRSIVS
ncbi:MAG: right-handed parallel beta-helix repeat-containing protein, partial [Bacteroidales bacterium]|nr:right-handed parallel beta-helix repeat-containing protein [Bacteroidales bacterium]